MFSGHIKGSEKKKKETKEKGSEKQRFSENQGRKEKQHTDAATFSPSSLHILGGLLRDTDLPQAAWGSQGGKSNCHLPIDQKQ